MYVSNNYVSISVLNHYGWYGPSGICHFGSLEKKDQLPALLSPVPSDMLRNPLDIQARGVWGLDLVE